MNLSLPKSVKLPSYGKRIRSSRDWLTLLAAGLFLLGCFLLVNASCWVLARARREFRWIQDRPINGLIRLAAI